MLKQKPVLSSIPAFDANFGTEGNEHIAAPVFHFSWKGEIARKNKLVIRDYTTNKTVYDHTIAGTALKHTLQRNTDTVAFNLKNGGKYIAEVYVYTEDSPTAESSPTSNQIIFHCFKTPDFRFTNFKNFFGEKETAIVNTNSVNLSVYYYQENNEALNTYKFELQDHNGRRLLVSDIKHSYLTKDLLTYSIGGLKETDTDNYGNLIENRGYKIICTGETMHGIAVYAEQYFVIKPVTSGTGALVRAENVGDGNVVIHSNYKVMNAICSTDKPIYLYDDDHQPYAIDLSNADTVEYIDGFLIEKPYEIILKGKFKPGILVTLYNADQRMGTISLEKISYTSVPYYCFTFTTTHNTVKHEIRTEYFNFFTTSIEAEIDLSYYNGLYNIKANIYNNETLFSITDNNKGNVVLLLAPSIPISNDLEGNVSITADMLTVTDDENGQITISD